MSSNIDFNYNEFIGRNIGFVSEAEQNKIKNAKIFIAGVGGMGGSALLNLVRAGVGEVWIADFDSFEVSNFNRQLFANIDYVGAPKVEATVEQIKKINPQIIIKTFDQSWVEQLDMILPQMTLAINGCDDARASITLMRKGRELGKTIIDAFAAPLPSVYVVRPKDPRPEEFMGYPSVGKKLDDLTPEILKGCFEKEILYVLINSSAHKHIVIEPTRELMEGKRKRFSFAPMVITTGALMAFEALRVILQKEEKILYKGYFFNPWSVKIETPVCLFKKPWRMIRTILFFKKVMGRL
jgi:molybdopterin/thiamine biosynthesis adenylyltransferase